MDDEQHKKLRTIVADLAPEGTTAELSDFLDTV